MTTTIHAAANLLRFWKMKFDRALLSCILLLTAWPVLSAESEKLGSSAWDQSVVSIEAARKQYDYYQPWSKNTRRLQKTGIIVGERQILTTADELFNRTLIRLQKGGRGRWWVGDVVWIDYHANLALITTSENDFWRDLKPVAFGNGNSCEGPMQILRWREGKLETRTAEFTQFTVREGQLSQLNLTALEASSEIQGVGWGEPLIANSRVVGIVWAQDGRTCVAAPSSFIQTIMKAHEKPDYRGLGYFHFFWQSSENPASLARLKLTGEPRGVIVIDVPARPDECEQVLRTDDIILNIDGFDLDIQGDYKDPEFGHLMLERLATREKWAGDDVKMQIWRDGKPLDVKYRLPRFDYTNNLVVNATYDKEPEYLIVGGLVFQPVTDSYLQSWGSDWKRRAPFRLNYYRNESPSKDRPALLMLSQVLPDPYNIGYQDLKYLVLEKVNGQPVHRFPELREALLKPDGGFHKLEFVQGETLRHMVVAAGSAEQTATARVLKRYNITEGSHFTSNAKN
jgi:S1-C subfamily serine protease